MRIHRKAIYIGSDTKGVGIVASVAVTVNGRSTSLAYADGRQQLLYLLREQLGLNGPRFGCGIAQCGACTVLVDGAVVRSCVKPVSSLHGGEAITTLEGIGTPDRPHPLQQAFLDKQAGQCAFCSNAMIMGALGWLTARGGGDVPSRREIAAFLSGTAPGSSLKYICRCGSHLRIIDAIREAAGRML